MFDLRSLRYFVAAYEERSITRAARRCAISQPSITAAIQNLEASLDAILLERSRTGLTPTAKGERLYRRATGLLAEAAAVQEEVRSTSGRRLSFFIQGDVALSAAAPVLQATYGLDPSLTLDIVEGLVDAQIGLVARHAAPPGRLFLPLWEEAYVVLIPDRHPMRFRAAVRLIDLDGVAMIERPRCALSESFDRALKMEGVRPDVRGRAGTEDAVHALVALGVGLAIAPESSARTAKGVVTRPFRLDQPFRRVVGLSCNDTVADLGRGLATRITSVSVDVSSASADPQEAFRHHEIVAFDLNLRG